MPCHISSFLKILRSFFIGMFDSKPGEVGNDSDPSGASFWKMDGDDKTELNRLVYILMHIKLGLSFGQISSLN